MASRANVVETMKQALPGKGGAVPVVPVYATYSSDGTTDTVLDINGNALVLDFSGFVAGAMLWGNASAGSGTLTFSIAGTAVLVPSATTADQASGTFITADYSERDFVAGSAVTIANDSSNLKTGSIMLFCIPT